MANDLSGKGPGGRCASSPGETRTGPASAVGAAAADARRTARARCLRF